MADVFKNSCMTNNLRSSRYLINRNSGGRLKKPAFHDVRLRIETLIFKN